MSENRELWTGERLSLEFKESLAIIKLFNPDRGLMDPIMEKELLDVLDRLRQWPEGRVVILTGGQPDVFIRHYDVSVLLERSLDMRRRGLTFSRQRIVPASPIHRVASLMEESHLIFIAAINGTAMGGGFELALACDLRVVQRGSFELGLPEVNIGLLPGAGGTQRLAKMVGQGRAMQWMLLGKTLTPQEMVEHGLAVAAVDNALVHSMELAHQIARRPAKACGHIKALVRGASDWEMSDGLGIERTLFCDCMVDAAAEPLMRAVGSGERALSQLPPRR